MNDNGVELTVLSLVSAGAKASPTAPPPSARTANDGRATEPVVPQNPSRFAGASRLRAAALHDAEARLRRLHAERLLVR